MFEMGRFLKKLWQGAKKVGRFIGNVAGKVRDVAGVLSNVPILGGVASTVARGANLVNKIATGATNFMDKVEQKKQQYQPVINKVKDAAQAIHQSGVVDKLTRGGLTRVIDKGRRLRDRMEQRYDAAAGRAGKIGGRIEAGVDKFRDATRVVVGGRGGRPPNTRVSSVPPLPSPPK